MGRWSSLRMNMLVGVALLLCLVVEQAGVMLDLGRYELLVSRMVAFSLLSIVILMRTSMRKGIFKSVVTLAVPLLAFAVVVLGIANISLADNLAMEDGVVEWLSALLLFVGAMGMVVVTVMLCRHRESAMAAIAALLLAIVFFIIGMEEVSWMQRVFVIEAPEALVEANSQGELNFHNIATGFFEQTYYLGGFILLTLIPFMRNSLKAFLEQFTTTRKLPLLLPPAWFVIPFSVIVGFVPYDSPNAFTYTLIYTLLFVVLILYVHNEKQVSSAALVATAIAFITIIIGIITLDFVDYRSVARPWYATEYREFFIALGIAIYAMDVAWRYSLSKQNTRKRGASEDIV